MKFHRYEVVVAGRIMFLTLNEREAVRVLLEYLSLGYSTAYARFGMRRLLIGDEGQVVLEKVPDLKVPRRLNAKARRKITRGLRAA